MRLMRILEYNIWSFIVINLKTSQILNKYKDIIKKSEIMSIEKYAIGK